MKYIILPALLALTACEAPITQVTRAEPDLLRTRMEGPPGATADQCWGRITTPAVIETITEDMLLQPAEIGEDGTIRSAPVYKSETRQAIVRERQDLWFETPCDAKLTPGFIASVQRALAVRGIYNGAITGTMDDTTKAAIRAYQEPQGLNSVILSTAAARQLGLITIAEAG